MLADVEELENWFDRYRLTSELLFHSAEFFRLVGQMNAIYRRIVKSSLLSEDEKIQLVEYISLFCQSTELDISASFDKGTD